MGVVSNRFFVTALQDGTVVNAVIYSDKPLSQLVGDGTATPNWETDSSSRPVIYCVTRKGATMTRPAEWAWSFNNQPITFTGTPVKDVTISDDGCFMYTEKTLTYGTPPVTVNFPAIKPLKNIDDLPVGRDNNTVSCSGNVTVGTAPLAFDVSTTVRKTTLGSSSFYGWIEGDSFVTAQTGEGSTATMTAHLNDGTEPTGDYNTVWTIEGVTAPGWPKSAYPEGSSVTVEESISGSEFTDYAVIRVDFYEGRSTTKKIATAFWGVDDMEDLEEMYICSYNASVQSGLDVSLRTSQQAQFVAWMAKRGDETAVDARYTTFHCKLLDAWGNVITSDFSGVSTPHGELVVDPSTGWFNITVTDLQQPVSADYAGKVIVQATFAEAHGGRVTGIVKATSAS